jgi:hypothetical protein
VRETNGRLLVAATVVRAQAGDVYVNWPRPGHPGWNPHTSYHASGQHHQKSFGRAAMKRTLQRPDGNFFGEANVITFGIELLEAATVNVACVPGDYSAVFELASADLHPKKCVSIDLAAPGGKPIMPAGSTILKASTYSDAIPWLLITFFDTSTAVT